MGDARVNPRIVVAVLVAVGCVLIAGGIWKLCGPGWAMLAGGALTIAYALVMVDIPARVTRVTGAARASGSTARRPEGG